MRFYYASKVVKCCLYTKEGKIDHELISLSSKPTPISDIGSLIHRKYMYPRSNDTVTVKAANILFTKPTPYTYIYNSYDENTISFYSMLLTKDVRRSDYDKYLAYQKNIDFLLEHHIIYNDEDGRLKPNRDIANILFYLYRYDSICMYYLFYNRDRLLDVEEKYHLDNYFIYEEKLFTRKEVEYLNYVLNKSKFYNGDDLRNKYMHGSYQLDEKKIENDYLLALKIAVMIVIKINEEFRLRSRFSS